MKNFKCDSAEYYRQQAELLDDPNLKIRLYECASRVEERYFSLHEATSINERYAKYGELIKDDNARLKAEAIERTNQAKEVTNQAIEQTNQAKEATAKSKEEARISTNEVIKLLAIMGGIGLAAYYKKEELVQLFNGVYSMVNSQSEKEEEKEEGV